MGFADKFRTLFKGSSKLRVSERFEILKEAISGTMSKFHQVRDVRSGEVFGLKICDIEKRDFFENRFSGLEKPAEGEIGVLFDHPHIVKTIEYGLTSNDEYFVLMEYLDGPGLNVCIKRIPPEFAIHRLALIRQMAAALSAVHKAGFIHRDICPRNFICSSDLKSLKLIDFGLTVPATKSFMQPGNRTGTPNYMAPEVIRRKATDPRLDIFAFGVTAFQMLTLDLPWPSQDVSGKAAVSHDTQAPTNLLTIRPDLHPDLAAAVMACLAREPSQRPATFDEFLARIEHVTTETI